MNNKPLLSELVNVIASPSLSTAGMEALAHIKAFIREACSCDAIDNRALELAGLSAEDIEHGIAEFSHDLARELMQQHSPLSDDLISGISIGVAAMVRDRIAEIQATGSGWA